MKTSIVCDNLYSDIDGLFTLIDAMEYTEGPLGSEILDFQYIPSNINEYLCDIVQESVEIQSDSGIFRKPTSHIHFEPFYQHAAWLCIVAIAPTTLTIHKHVDGYDAVYAIAHADTFIQEHIQVADKWTAGMTVAMAANDFIFIRPWVWHSLTENKLVQLFLLNHQLTDKD